ncbi:MAG: SDR family NAD(P)-dependent oxidoreductase [Leucobacter sp.]
MPHSTYLDALFSLSGKRALVTGGSSGIGRAIALALAGAGAHVVIAARTTADIDAVVKEALSKGGSAEGVTANLSTRVGIHALADAVSDIDIVVNSAGVNIRPPMSNLTESDWDVTMAVNLEAPFILGQRLSPAMVSRGYGRLIHVSSQQAHRPFASSGAYGVSKAAVESLARVQSEAWAPHGVTANTLVPGFVQTRLNERLSADPGVVESLAARTLVGRNGRPGDFAGIAVFLAGNSSAYITGQTIPVDGGFSTH